jgi:hypothetical protein
MKGFFDDVRNIENVREDIREYTEKEIVPSIIKSKVIDQDELFKVVDYSMNLAKDLHLEYNITFMAAVLHDIESLDSEENNFDTLTAINSDQYLLNFFQEYEMEIIGNAAKEHDGHSREMKNFTSLYSRVLADAVVMSTIPIDMAMRSYWKKYEKKEEVTEREAFKEMYMEMKNYYMNLDEKDFLLKKSYEEIREELINTQGYLSHVDRTYQKFSEMLRYLRSPDPNDDVVSEGVIDNDFLFETFENSFNNIVINEATQNKSKREKAESLIYRVLSILDKTKINVVKYKEFFGKMSDEEFDKYMNKFLADENENFYIEILPNKNEPKMEEIKKALDVLKVPADEYVYMRHEGHGDDPIRTAYKVPVGYITIRRLQQILSKKNTYSLDISQRNMRNGQVTGDDKIARISDIESYSLVAIGAENALKEFLGPRADNAVAKTDMYKDIGMYGYTYLKDQGHDITENQTLNTMYVHLMGAGIGNDLLKEEDLEKFLDKES